MAARRTSNATLPPNSADDVAALLDHLKIPKADLIGYSMGGGVAMQCAFPGDPDKVRKGC